MYLGILWMLLCSFPNSAQALTDLKCYLNPGCRGQGGAAANPSATNHVKINPSAVPTEKGLGVEMIYYKDEVDFGIVRGTGRVGAALSPSNSEETFFGPPGFELPEDIQTRKQDKKKYPSQKITLATAFNVMENRSSDLQGYSVKLGLLAKYNRLTHDVLPGAGLSGSLGPFTFGYSIYNDETQLDYSTYGSTLKPKVTYQVQSYNVGIFLSSLIVDYSNLKVATTDESTVRLLTASLMLKKIILTASKRTEDSTRPAYNYDTKSLEAKKTKEEMFGGVQYYVTSNFMLGALYNYYLLHEYSATATIFF